MTNNHLISYFPDYLSDNALFTKMVTLGAPWSTDVGQDMDDAYFTMYSGVKNPSDFVTLHLNPGTEVANSLTIARILYGMFGENWTRLWEAFKTRYTPIDNYNLQETITTTISSDRNISRTNDLSSTVDGTETQTTTSDRDINRANDLSSIVDGTETRTTEEDSSQGVNATSSSKTSLDGSGTSTLQHGEQIQHDSETDSFRYGFNSTERVPSDAQTEVFSDIHSGTDTTTTTNKSATDTSSESKTDTIEHGTSTINIVTKDARVDKTVEDTIEHGTSAIDIVTKDVRTDKTVEDTLDTNSGKEDIQRTRKGNVGQNSYQELLRQEFELWRWNFFTRVFEDVDTFLVLSVYSSCTK